MYSTIGNYLFITEDKPKKNIEKPVLYEYTPFEKPESVKQVKPNMEKPNMEKSNMEKVKKVSFNIPSYSPSSTSSIDGGTDPKIWGPHFWFTLHNSAAYYPMEASPLVQARMKNRILAIPYELPCQNCRIHASAFIESKKDDLDEIVKGRHSLGSFFVNFHNKVNERYGKPLWTYEQAYKKYHKTNIVHM